MYNDLFFLKWFASSDSLISVSLDHTQTTLLSFLNTKLQCFLYDSKRFALYSTGQQNRDDVPAMSVCFISQSSVVNALTRAVQISAS